MSTKYLKNALCFFSQNNNFHKALCFLNSFYVISGCQQSVNLTQCHINVQLS